MSAYVQTVVGSDSPPVGAVMDFTGNVEPSGWLFCFGQSLPRVGIYAQLFQVIGTLYGSVDGSSFSLPDFRGRVGAGKDNMGGVAASRLTSTWGVDGVTLGANGGSESHQLTIAQLAAHTHTEMRTAIVSGNLNTASGTSASSTFGLNTGSTGGDQAHPNVQPTFVVNKIIKYTVSGTVLPIVPGEGDVVGPDGGVADGDLAVFGGTSGKLIRRGSLFPRGHLAGLTIANNITDATNDIDISEGQCRNSTNSVDINLSSGLTKQLDAAWAEGTNQGGRDTGAIADAWWHVFVIRNPTTGVVDALFSQSPTAPTLPSGFTVFRRIGSVLRSSATLQSFLQLGDQFAMASVSAYGSTAARAFAAFTMTRCPLGIITFPIMKVQIVATSGISYFTFGQGMDSTLLIANTPQTNIGSNVDTVVLTEICTNFSQQIYFQVSTAGTIGAALINHHGYLDNRGKDGYSP